jgi:hypothetical protein
MSKIEVDAITQQSGSTLTVGGGASKTVVADATTVTLGRCGGTVALASGATQSGFGRTGTVDWQTGSIKTSTFTAANGEGYFADTSSGGFTMNLPAGTAGNIVSVVDYTNTFQTNALTIAPNGSQKIGGVAASNTLNTEGQSVTFVYVDDTEGWKNVQDSTSNVIGNPNLVATGGTVTTCGNFKIHTFTGPGTFTVCKVSSTAAENTVGYMVVAGGGGGGGGTTPSGGQGGGGAGGFREGRNAPVDNFTASPLVANAPTNAVTVTATSFPITVGAGGDGGSSNPGAQLNTPGSPSTFSTITSTGGGNGGGTSHTTPPSSPVNGLGTDGGSGGGPGYGQSPSTPTVAGAGNTPPVSPSQGFPGGTALYAGPQYGGAGGGGASAAGGNGSGGGSGSGGAGVSTSITGSSVARAGGGGGGQTSGNGACGGAGGGGNGGQPAPIAGSAATVNTGGGGGGGSRKCGGNGGSGIVVIRYKFQ